MAHPPPVPTTPQTHLTGHKSAIRALAWSNKDSTHLLTGSEDATIRIWRPSSLKTRETRQHISTLQTGYAVLDLAIDSSNESILCCGNDKAVTLWGVRGEECLRRWSGFARVQNCVGFAGVEGRVVLVGGLDGRVLGFDGLQKGRGQALVEWKEARDAVLCLHVVEGGREVFVGSAEGVVRVYDVEMGSVVVDVVTGSKGVGVCDVRPSGDGESYLAVCMDSRVRLIDRRSGKCLRVFEHPGFVVREFTIRGTWAIGDRVVVCGSEEGDVFFWDVGTGELLGRVSHWKEGANAKRKAVSAVAWNAVTGQLASAGMNGEVVVWV